VRGFAANGPARPRSRLGFHDVPDLRELSLSCASW
jgi:hypothetical protein